MVGCWVECGEDPVLVWQAGGCVVFLPLLEVEGEGNRNRVWQLLELKLVRAGCSIRCSDDDSMMQCS